MVNIANIACKTVGLAGMSAVLYDAYGTARHHSAAGAAKASADVYESAVAAERSNAGASYVTGAMQRKVADLRMSNPIIPIYGRIKGFFKAFFNSIGDNIVLAGFASMALAGKGFWGKLGAFGSAGFVGFKILKEGFGVGKKSPVDS